MKLEKSPKLSPVLAANYPHIRMIILNDIFVAICNLLPLENNRPQLCPKIGKQILDSISLTNPNKPHEVQDFDPKPEFICVDCPICKNTDHKKAML
jgi:hypothetical protein